MNVGAERPMPRPTPIRLTDTPPVLDGYKVNPASPWRIVKMT